MNGHTPGRWTKNAYPSHWAIRSKNKRTLCDVYGATQWNDEGWHNAELIAKAPDLLSLNRELVEALEGLRISECSCATYALCEGSSAHHSMCQMRNSVESVRYAQAVVAKAKDILK